MKNLLLAGIIVFFLSSCNPPEKFPEFVTAKTEPENVNVAAGWNRNINHTNVPDVNIENYPLLDSLMEFHKMYIEKNENFNLAKYRSTWGKLRNRINAQSLSVQEALQWFEVSGFLFQLTGDALVAEELQKIVWTRLSEYEKLDSLIEPYIFTKSVDHIHLNLFIPAEISYEHSMGGRVKISQKTDFPASGSIWLTFEMEPKNYIELFVRIPSWAEQSSVTVKQVKYLTTPGVYSKIAKKWKEGDVVEIEMALNNLPEYFKTGN